MGAGVTLKLVSDNTVELPVYNFKDMGACARKWADDLEAGKHGEPTRVIVLIDTPEGVAIQYWGETASGLEIMGLLEVGKMTSTKQTRIDPF